MSKSVIGYLKKIITKVWGGVEPQVVELFLRLPLNSPRIVLFQAGLLAARFHWSRLRTIKARKVVSKLNN